MRKALGRRTFFQKTLYKSEKSVYNGFTERSDRSYNINSKGNEREETAFGLKESVPRGLRGDVGRGGCRLCARELKR